MAAPAINGGGTGDTDTQGSGLVIPPMPGEDAGESDPSSPGFFGTLGDMAQGVVAGAWDGVAETANLAPDLGNFVAGEGTFGDILPQSKDYISIDTGWGKGAKSVTQFLVGFLGLGKAATGLKMFSGTTKAAKAVKVTAQGFVADFTAFDAHEERFSDFVESFPILKNPITKYLAEDGPDDSAALGRLKNAVDGMGFGLIMEKAITTVAKGFKSMRAAKNPAQAAKAMEEMHAELKATGIEDAAKASQGRQIEAAISGNTEELTQALKAGGGKASLVVEGADAKAVQNAVEGFAKEQADSAAMLKSGAPPAEAPKLLTGDEMRKLMAESLDAGRDFSDVTETLIGNLRTVSHASDEERRLFLAHAQEAMIDTFKGRGVKTNEALMDDAWDFLMMNNQADLHKQALKDEVVIAELPARWQSYKIATVVESRTMLDLEAKMALGTGDNAVLRQQFEEASRRFQDFSRVSKNIMTTGGRLVQGAKLDPSEYIPADEMLGILKAAGGDPVKVSRIQHMLTMTPWQRGRRIFQETVINGLLSSPKTQAINIASNAIQTMLMPAEKILGGAVRGDVRSTYEGMQQVASLWKAMKESFQYAKMALETGENVLDAGYRMTDGSNQYLLTTYTKIKQDMLLRKQHFGKGDTLSPLEELMAGSMMLLGGPSRLLGTADEFFKQLNYRSNVYGKLHADALRLHHGNPTAMAKYVDDGFRAAFEYKNGAATRGLDKDALQWARESTFTQGLEYGAGKWLQGMVNDTPMLRYIIPFVKTPTNIFRSFVAHTPGLNMLTRQYKEAMAAGGERAALAQGRMAAGGMFWLGASMLAYSGKITGGYPKDPAARQAWIDNGIEPYSFRIGDKYVSYARFDPFATFFGLAADMAEYGRTWGDTAKGHIASMVMVAVGNNLTRKSYLTGITDLMAALSDDSVESSAVERLLRRTTAMLVPYSSGLRFTRQLQDDSMREVRGFWDQIYNGIPWASEALGERTSWLTGQPVANNTFWTDHKNDTVLREIARLGPSISAGPPPKELGGVELTGQQYSRLCQLQGTHRIGGLTLHERLERIMASPSYDIGRKRMPDMPLDQDSPRSELVRDAILRYRKAAQATLKQEDRSLQQSVEHAQKVKRTARQGDAAGLKSLLTMPPKP